MKIYSRKKEKEEDWRRETTVANWKQKAARSSATLTTPCSGTNYRLVLMQAKEGQRKNLYSYAFEDGVEQQS